jgi:diacylglycerol O-acyltransferase / wax synthase
MTQESPRPEQRFAQRMSDAEALMWNIDKDPWLNPSGCSLLILDGPIDVDHFRSHIARAVAEVPRLRERVVATLGRLSPPQWRPDPEFDLAYHIRHIVLAPPGTMRDLLDLVSILYQDPYDRTRPLWAFYVIDGLEGGRSALLWKLHHAVADGMGAGGIADYHLQRSRRAPAAAEVDLNKLVRSALEADRDDGGQWAGLPVAALRTVGHTWRRQAGIARRLTGELVQCAADPARAVDAATGLVRTVRQVRTQLLGEGTPGGSPLWGQRSRGRHLDVLGVSLEEVKAAAKNLGGTVNDLFVTGAVIGALAYHDRRHAPVQALNITFVVSTREDRTIGGNAMTPTRLQAPGGPMDPAERFRAISARLAARRAEVRGQGMLSGLAGVANLFPTSFVTSAVRSQARKVDFATSNLRGARSAQYVSGAQVLHKYAFGPVAGTAFNLTAFSYAGRFEMALAIDPAAVENPAELRQHLEDGYAELLQAGGAIP